MTGVNFQVLVGDVLSQLATLADESVQCVVTSPPYWGLRDYGTATWEGGSGECEHLGEPFRTKAKLNENWGKGYSDVKNGEGRQPMGQTCGKCGALRIDSQIGLERTPEEYVAKMVEVFREVRRVLRRDGTCWINMGDSYSNDTKWGGTSGGKNYTSAAGGYQGQRVRRGKDCDPKRGPAAPGQPLQQNNSGLKPKDLVGMPWRLAFALQADGWHLRADVIWWKPNPMPESVTDRPTKSHEYIFLLSKSQRYFYDAEAIKEECTGEAHSRGDGVNPKAKKHGQHSRMQDDRDPRHLQYGPKSKQNESFSGAVNELITSRNKRSVWEVATQAYSEAHFATFPEALIQPCILAGTSEHGCCSLCAAPWKRVVKVEYDNPGNRSTNGPRSTENRKTTAGFDVRLERNSTTTGWNPTCKCQGNPVPCTVLDPFGGSGTTAVVALRYGRNAIIIELNPKYAEMASNRIVGDAPLFRAKAPESDDEPAQMFLDINPPIGLR